MFRLSLLTLLISFALQADTFTFSSCAAGATTVSPCGGNILLPGGITNATGAAAEASDNSIVPGVSTPGQPFTGQALSAAATAIVYGSSVDVSATAQANANGYYTSAGPTRTGFIELLLTWTGRTAGTRAS